MQEQQKQTIDITKMSLVELEALAYRLLREQSILQANIGAVEKEMQKYYSSTSVQEEIKD